MMAGALVKWLKLPAWNVDRGFDQRSVIPILKKQNVFFLLTRKY